MGRLEQELGKMLGSAYRLHGNTFEANWKLIRNGSIAYVS
jgi:hypothetical protein